MQVQSVIEVTGQRTAAGSTRIQTYPTGQRSRRGHGSYAPARVALLLPLPVAAPPASILNCSTRPCSSVPIFASSAAAFWLSAAPCVVPCAASATPLMLLVISPLPFAASLTLRAISL